MKLQRLRQNTRGNTEFLEEWLIDVANARGARIVVREGPMYLDSPQPHELTNEELVIGLVLLQNIDSPQIIRLAAQLISRGDLNMAELARLAIQERVEAILAELSREALKVAPDHTSWNRIRDLFGTESSVVSAILHYTRLAQPVMKNGRYNAEDWVLVQ